MNPSDGFTAPANAVDSRIPGWPHVSESQADFEVIYFPQNRADTSRYDMAEMLCKVNGLRMSRGLHPVVYHSDLEKLAQGHAQFQSRYRVITHADKSGHIGDRLTALGFQWDILLENIGAGANDVSGIFNAWVRSQDHLNNLLSADVRFMGVDVSNGFWVQDFAAPRDKNYAVPLNEIDACPSADRVVIYS
ncbi:hypothetical protein GGF37_000483 [Kickxella alabastrina]|nr:hypothetical protein GGF37_000483 [Kickxella alabastrina]